MKKCFPFLPNKLTVIQDSHHDITTLLCRVIRQNVLALRKEFAMFVVNVTPCCLILKLKSRLYKWAAVEEMKPPQLFL